MDRPVVIPKTEAGGKSFILGIPNYTGLIFLHIHFVKIVNES